MSASKLCNKQVAQMSHLWKKMKTNAETSEMDLPIQQKPGYLEFCEVHIFVLMDYAVSISFRTKNCSRQNIISLQNWNMQEDFLWQKFFLTVLGY